MRRRQVELGRVRSRSVSNRWVVLSRFRPLNILTRTISVGKPFVLSRNACLNVRRVLPNLVPRRRNWVNRQRAPVSLGRSPSLCL